jgi:hypothetical protein
MKKATQKQDLDPIALFLPAASSTSYSTGQEKQKKNIFLQKKKTRASYGNPLAVVSAATGLKSAEQIAKAMLWLQTYAGSF